MLQIFLTDTVIFCARNGTDDSSWVTPLIIVSVIMGLLLICGITIFCCSSCERRSRSYGGYVPVEEPVPVPVPVGGYPYYGPYTPYGGWPYYGPMPIPMPIPIGAPIPVPIGGPVPGE